MTETLTFAYDLVPKYCIAVDLRALSRTGRLAKELARRVDDVEGTALPQSPSSLATGSIYLATRLVGPNMAQSTIATATDTNEVSLRNAYHAIALELDLATESPPGREGIRLRPQQEWPAWVEDYAERSAPSA
jgi:transcription initiation factor TFIIIB Brf1 subunit/transcription initiation factor TFIIB